MRHRIEAVELLVASLFSDEAPLAPPATGLAGFLRFLLLLAGHDWATAPLLVDPQSELTAADREAAMEAFTLSRDRGACCFFIAYIFRLCFSFLASKRDGGEGGGIIGRNCGGDGCDGVKCVR